MTLHLKLKHMNLVGACVASVLLASCGGGGGGGNGGTPDPSIRCADGTKPVAVHEGGERCTIKALMNSSVDDSTVNHVTTDDSNTSWQYYCIKPTPSNQIPKEDPNDRGILTCKALPPPPVTTTYHALQCQKEDLFFPITPEDTSLNLTDCNTLKTQYPGIQKYDLKVANSLINAVHGWKAIKLSSSSNTPRQYYGATFSYTPPADGKTHSPSLCAIQFDSNLKVTLTSLAPLSDNMIQYDDAIINACAKNPQLDGAFAKFTASSKTDAKQSAFNY